MQNVVFARGEFSFAKCKDLRFTAAATCPRYPTDPLFAPAIIIFTNFVIFLETFVRDLESVTPSIKGKT